MNVSRVIEAVRRIPMQRGVVLACSGGADSTALAVAVCQLADDASEPITLAHVNHHLRGHDSDRDEAFVIQLANQLGVSIEIAHRPIDGDAAIEERARATRYEWFATIANGRPIVTAHTRDDQAETILHRIIRGTGIAGLAGIGDRAGIVRPFVDLTKPELIDFLNERGQPWREDTSNIDRRFTRNRLRHDVLPMLRELNPQVEGALMGLSEQAREWLEFADDLAARLVANAERPRVGGTIILSLPAIVDSPPLIVREMMRSIWHREGWPTVNMSAEHWRRLGRGEAGDYPGKVKVERTPHVLRMGRS